MNKEMKFELYREDHGGVDTKPFATAVTAAEAENEAVAEILEGDAEIVMVNGIGYIYAATMPCECAYCGNATVEVEHGTPVWYALHDTETPYCSFECLTAAASYWLLTKSDPQQVGWETGEAGPFRTIEDAEAYASDVFMGRTEFMIVQKVSR
jgi:hypothetical protein